MIEVRRLDTAPEFVEVDALFRDVWGLPTPLITLELMTAIVHGGGYAAGAVDASGALVGASFGFLALHEHELALHSHITGVRAEVRHRGVGRALKLDQRAWAADAGIEWITWTFDPLVRRNAWFNIAVLGAEVHAYLPSFYGEMNDAINAGDESDRLLMAWHVPTPVPSTPRDGRSVRDPLLVPTPPDIVEMRRSEPDAVRRWRTDTRTALTAALHAGRPVLGFTREGDYVIGSSS